MRVVVASPAFAAIAEYLPRFLPGAEVLFAGAADLPQVPGGEGRPRGREESAQGAEKNTVFTFVSVETPARRS